MKESNGAMWRDDYVATPQTFDELLSEVKDMEGASRWIDEIQSATLRLEDLSAPMFVAEAARNYGVDPVLAEETCQADNTRLMMLGLGVGAELVRGCALPSICETAKLSGSALGRMSPYQLKSVLNYGLEVSRGTTLALVRCGKLSACHSGGPGGYAIMPISDLLTTAKAALERLFGKLQLVSCTNSHELTEVLWALPEAADELREKYAAAVGNMASCYDLSRLMPAAVFRSSDTGTMCATLMPVMLMGRNIIRPVDGARVKHTKRGGGDPMEDFAEETGTLWAKYGDFIAAVKELAEIELHHPQEALISVCKKLNIPKGYAEVARQEVEYFQADGAPLSAHDLYLAATSAVAEAQDRGASPGAILKLEESVAKIARIRNWADHDVAGVKW